jgi:acylphosphatase
MSQALLKITGKVQGVWYRASAKELANELELTCHIENLSDGSVEAIVQGEKSTIEKFIKWCWTGPEHAQVENIELKWSD